MWLTGVMRARPTTSDTEVIDTWAWSIVDAVSAAAQACDHESVGRLLALLGGYAHDDMEADWLAASAEARYHNSPALAVAALDLAAAQVGANWSGAGDVACPAGRVALLNALALLTVHLVVWPCRCGVPCWPPGLAQHAGAPDNTYGSVALLMGRALRAAGPR